jgi:hypothetical protein
MVESNTLKPTEGHLSYAAITLFTPILHLKNEILIMHCVFGASR